MNQAAVSRPPKRPATHTVCLDGRRCCRPALRLQASNVPARGIRPSISGPVRFPEGGLDTIHRAGIGDRQAWFAPACLILGQTFSEPFFDSASVRPIRSLHRLPAHTSPSRFPRPLIVPVLSRETRDWIAVASEHGRPSAKQFTGSRLPIEDIWGPIRPGKGTAELAPYSSYIPDRRASSNNPLPRVRARPSRERLHQAPARGGPAVYGFRDRLSRCRGVDPLARSNPMPHRRAQSLNPLIGRNFPRPRACEPSAPTSWPALIIVSLLRATLLPAVLYIDIRPAPSRGQRFPRSIRVLLGRTSICAGLRCLRRAGLLRHADWSAVAP